MNYPCFFVKNEKRTIIGMLVDGMLFSMNDKTLDNVLLHECEIEPVYIDSKIGLSIYRRSIGEKDCW